VELEGIVLRFCDTKKEEKEKKALFIAKFTAVVQLNDQILVRHDGKMNARKVIAI